MSKTKEHHYRIAVEWTGNKGTGTSGYTHYERSHVVSVAGKQPISASSDPSFRGNPSYYNPEEMLVAALSSCHMLWYLHLASVSGIIVSTYVDQATGRMTETADGGGRFTEVVLHPEIVVQKGADLKVANELHEKAHHLCFIANSVNFPVRCEPIFRELEK
jgi:organic hydroperoxide reductase OsmC/OhrA